MNKCCTKCSGGAYPCANTNCNCHAIQKQSTPSEQRESCYCVCHSPYSSAPSCKHCIWAVEVALASTKDISDKEELCICGAKKSNDWHSVPTKPEVKIKIEPSSRIDYCCECKTEHGYDCPKDKPEVSTWEERFDNIPDSSLYAVENLSVIERKKTKAFIEKELDEARKEAKNELRAELVEKVKKLRLTDFGIYISPDENGAYNLALDEVIKVIQEKGNSDD